MPGDAVFLDQGNEIRWGVTGQGGFGEVGIGGEEIFGCGVNVGEIATTTAGDEDFFANAVGMFEDRDAAAAFASFDGAEKAGGASAEDHNVKGTGQMGLTGKSLWVRFDTRGSVGQQSCVEKKKTKSRQDDCATSSIESSGKFGMAEVLEEESDLGSGDARKGE